MAPRRHCRGPVGRPRAAAEDVAAAGPGGAGSSLRPDEVQRVLARALLLEDVRSELATGPGLEDVQDVAAQLGVHPATVRRALDEVRLDMAIGTTRGRGPRLLGPRSVTGGALVRAAPTHVRRGAAAWMRDDEGLVRRGARDATERWVEDGRVLVKVRRGLGAERGDGVLRGMREVAVQVDEATDGSVLLVEADTAPVRVATTAVLAAGTGLGVLAGALTAVIAPETAAISSDVAQFAVPFAATVTAAVGTAAVTSWAWVRQVRTAVDRAVEGITLTAQDPASLDPPPGAGGWRRTALRWLGQDPPA